MKLVCVTVCALALALSACKKKEAPKPVDKPTAPTGSTAAPAPAPAPALAPAAAKAPQTGAELAKRFEACWELFNKKAWPDFGKCFSADAVFTDSMRPGLSIAGRDKIVADAQNYTAAFPDMAGESQLVLVSADRRVAAIKLMRGTQSGALKTPQGAIPPSGKKVGYLMAHEVNISPAGEVTRQHILSDSSTFMFQIGVSPRPSREAMTTGWAERPTAIATGSPTESANLAAYRAYYEVFNKHDAKGVLAAYAPSPVESHVAQKKDTVGIEAIEKMTEHLWKSFPDVKITLADAFAAGDYTFGKAVFEGTNTGSAGKMPATGKKVVLNASEFVKWEGGKMKHVWLFYDSMEMARQLGLLPPPGAAPKK